jgi:hypothetical protein
MTISITSPTSTTSKIQQNGNDVLTVDSSNNVTVINNLSVSGTVTASGNINFDSNTLYVDATNNNVGIGTSSPSNTLTVSFNANAQKWAQFLNTNAGSSSTGGLLFGNDSNGAQASMFVGSGTYGSYGGANSLNLGTFGGGAVTFFTSATERMRIDSSGNVLIGKTTTGYNTPGISFTPNGSSSFATNANNGNIQFSAPVSQSQIAFYRQDTGALMGYIINGASNTVSYATSSDYRLKENIVPMTGALATVQALKPVTYKWKTDGSDGQGFIAHELQAVVPDCVSGEKDAVETYTDEEGNEQTRPKYQGVDTSFLVATLTAAIQEQQDIIKALETRIATLESN